MEKSKRCRHKDRLSELPDSVIFEIFGFLRMTDVVKTSVLSKRWRNLWTITPFLNFDSGIMFFMFDINKIRNFVNRALLCWHGNRVLKFGFDSLHILDSSIFRDIDLWVSFAKRNGVEELYLNVPCHGSTDFDVREDMYWVPQCLYSCSSLKKLTIVDCNFGIFGNVQWIQLKTLRIEGFGVTAFMINQILLGSPQLRVFNLSLADSGEKFSIQSSSLKELSIETYLLDYRYLSTVSELRIWTPNLEMLEITGIPHSKCLLMNVSSLTHATLGFCGLQHCDQNDDVAHDVEFENGLFSGNDYQGNALSQILPTLQHVGNVKLSNCCIKVLKVMKMKCIDSSFPNVKSLELKCCYYDYKKVVVLLEIFPQLERLVLKDNRGDTYQDDRESLKFEANLPNLLQLRRIEVIWDEGDGVFPLIEFMLKYASKLEKIVFRLKVFEPSSGPSRPLDSLFLASQKLLRMPRSSTNCTIDIMKSLI